MYKRQGDEFAVQRANSAALGIGDTMQVGSFRPAGDSPLGGADMAGNVAEWTSTPFMQDGVTLYLVKGGTFGDAAEGLRTAALVPAAPRTTAKWLGVRCAADVESVSYTHLDVYKRQPQYLRGR